MAFEEPWLKSEAAGPKRALVAREPKVIAALVKGASRPLIVTGNRVLRYKVEFDMLEYLVELSRRAKAQIVATAQLANEFWRREFVNVMNMDLIKLADRLKDPEWRGLDEMGPYDLVMFIGLFYPTGWLLLSGLKNFAPNLRTISLDPFYNPNSTISLPNLKIGEWSKYLSELLALL